MIGAMMMRDGCDNDDDDDDDDDEYDDDDDDNDNYFIEFSDVFNICY